MGELGTVSARALIQDWAGKLNALLHSLLNSLAFLVFGIPFGPNIRRLTCSAMAVGHFLGHL